MFAPSIFLSNLILNFLRAGSYLIVLLQTRTVLEIIATTSGDSTCILDLSPRLFDCDFILNRLYFFWTNFFYLYYFLLIILLYLTAYNFLRKLFQPLLLLFFLLLSNYFLSIDYWFLNLDTKYLNSELLNPLLLNSINKYHPLLFYSTTSFVVLYSIQSFEGLRFYIGSKVQQSAILSGLQILIFTLLLGSWWALQEGSWGGWWNWDPSEVLGLLVVIHYLVILHSKKLTYFKKRYFVSLVFMSFILIIIYLLIQLNFDLVSHNFGTRTNVFTSIVELLSLEMFILLVALPLFALYKFRLTVIHKDIKVDPRAYNFILLILVLVLLYFSFKLLITDSLWQFISFNSTNYLFNLKLIIIYISLILVLYLWEVSFVTLCSIIFFYYYANFVMLTSILMLVMTTLLNTTYLVHILLIFAIYFNLETYFKSILLFGKNNLIYNYYVSLTDSTIYVSKNLINSYINSEKSTHSFLEGTTNSQWFSKLSTGDFLEQVLKEGSLNLKFNVNIFEFGHMNLLAIFVLNTLILFSQKNIKYKITF